MNERLFFLFLKIGTILLGVLGLAVSSLLIYLTLFKGGYKFYVEREQRLQMYEAYEKVMRRAQPVRDWGGDIQWEHLR